MDDGEGVVGVDFESDVDVGDGDGEVTDDADVVPKFVEDTTVSVEEDEDVDGGAADVDETAAAVADEVLSELTDDTGLDAALEVPELSEEFGVSEAFGVSEVFEVSTTDCAPVLDPLFSILAACEPLLISELDLLSTAFEVCEMEASLIVVVTKAVEITLVMKEEGVKVTVDTEITETDGLGASSANITAAMKGRRRRAFQRILMMDAKCDGQLYIVVRSCLRGV
jgi:hypothetical protein